MDCPMELQAANNVRRLRGYEDMDWALNDSLGFTRGTSSRGR